MIQALYDIRFAFDSDNPFEKDSSKIYLNKLKKYLADNADTFTEIDYLDTSKYLMVCPELKTIFGEPVDRKTCISEKLNLEIKRFIKENIPQLPEELQKWVSDTSGANKGKVIQSLAGGAVSDVDVKLDPTTAIIEAEGFGTPIVPSDGKSFTSNSTLGLQYDIGSDKMLSYSEVCKICVNLARSKALAANTFDPALAALERDKKIKLIREIHRYKSNTQIDPYVDGDLAPMSIDELEQILETCKMHQERFKVRETFTRGLQACGTVYDAIFPEGIPVTKNKRVCFKGFGKELLSTMFNQTTTIGLAFQNILNKNNIHVSDELLILLVFGETCLQKVEIKTVEPQKEEKESVTVEQLGEVNAAIRKDLSKEYASSDLEDIDDEEYEEDDDE